MEQPTEPGPVLQYSNTPVLQYSFPAFAGLIGVASEDITPPVGIYARNWGAAQHDVAEGLHRPLTATALTISSLTTHHSPLTLISLDFGWWRTVEDEWYIRGGLIEELALDPARVMMALSHTHSGPSICYEDSDKPGGHLIAPYLEHVRDSVIRATRSALEDSRPGTLDWAYGRCGLAQNRDLPDPENPRIVCGFNPDGQADDTLLVGRVSGDDGRIIATLVNYACHPVTLAWQNRLISPDYAGAMRELIESQTGAPCLFLQGASGELAPMRQYTADTAIADSNGRQLGYAVLSALEGMLPPRTSLRYSGAVESGAPLGTWSEEATEPSINLEAICVDVELPLKSLPSLASLDAEIASCTDRALAERLVRKRRIVRVVGERPTSPRKLCAWRIGDAVLLGHGNEAYSHLQTSLRSRFQDKAIAVMNLVNGCCGYLPPSELYDQDIYQVWQTPFERGSLEILQRESAKAIQRLLG